MPTTQDASTDQQRQFHPEIVKKIKDKTVNDKYLHCISGCDWGILTRFMGGYTERIHDV
jgi:hypothetical protein